MNRPVEMGVDMAVAENRAIMSCLVPQADSRALQIAGLEGDPWFIQWGGLWALEQGRD